jgi:pimeloyl-ACP methyl ester carboxylesterase
VIRLLPALALCLAAVAHPAVAAETRPLSLAGEQTLVDLYWPAASPPRALVVIAHGFTRTRARHVILANRLAEAGFAVAVPNLPHWFNPRGDADAIVDLVRAVETERELGSRPAVLIGTSAGGRASLLAANRVPRLALWVGLDPVDAMGIADEAARALPAAAVVLRAPSGHCNAGGSAKRIATRLPNLRAEMRIPGASHCDFEDTTNGRCEALCGAADPARQALIVEATVKVVTDALPAPAVAH